MVTVQSWLQALDGIAVKPSQMALREAIDLPVDTVVVDFEGTEHVPRTEILDRAATATRLRVTVPVRSDGFDPVGDDTRLRSLPPAVGRVYVAGHPSYLSAAERSRTVGTRLVAAADRTPTAWVGTESVERMALATGLTQFELLGPTTERTILGLRAADVTMTVAVYAPVVASTDEDTILDAVGDYVARRPSVATRLPEAAGTDSGVTGPTRRTLLDGARRVALVGDSATIRHRIDRLRAVGVDHVIGYPATGLERLGTR